MGVRLLRLPPQAEWSRNDRLISWEIGPTI